MNGGVDTGAAGVWLWEFGKLILLPSPKTLATIEEKGNYPFGRLPSQRNSTPDMDFEPFGKLGDRI